MVKGVPMDNSRVMPDRCLLVRPEVCVINVDETGCADFVDARNEDIIVPVSSEGDKIPIPIDRTIECTSLIAGIAADGMALKPIMIVSRKTIDREARLWGYGSKNVLFVHQENDSISTPIFET
jgi:hypothetical protein